MSPFYSIIQLATGRKVAILQYFSMLMLLIPTLGPSVVTARDSVGTIYSFGKKVTCEDEKTFIEMQPRAPEIGEKATIHAQSGEIFIQGKVTVKVFSKAKNKVIKKMTVEDFTDPWEAAWPDFRFENADFRFFAQNPGKPTVFKIREISTASEMICKY